MQGNTKSIKWVLSRVILSKEVPTKHIYEKQKTKTPIPFLGNQHDNTASLKCLYSNVCIMENKHEKLDICVYLQDYDPVEIAKMWWNVLHD